MPDWLRSTHSRTLDGLEAGIQAAVRAHLKLHNLGDILADYLACVETTSERIGKGILGRGGRIVVAVVVTPYWLIWAIRASDPEVTVMSARLADILVKDYEATPFANRIPDQGVEISGTFTDVSEQGSAFIGLGSEPAAQVFRATLTAAVHAAKR